MPRRTCYTALAPLAAWIVATSLAPQASASGFQLREQSPSAQGTSFAGVSAGGSDIGSMFFNPATLTLFQGNQSVLGMSEVMPKAKLEGAVGTRSASLPAPYQPIKGSDSEANAAKSALLPNLYAMWSVSSDLKLGLSVNAPFGMSTNYDATFVGRYHALKSDLTVLDIAPTIAYRINPQWSVGAAFVARKADAELTNAVDFGSAILANPLIPAFMKAGVTPGGSDGVASLKGSKWGYGYRLGIVFQPSETLRLGLAHQSAMSMTLSGDATFTGVPALLAGSIKNVSATAELNLPSTTSLGINLDVSPTISVQSELARTNWSSFKELRVKFSGGVPSDSITEEQWRDTWFYSLGLTWKATEAWTLRTGLAYDQCAVKDEFRTPRIPDGNRTWVSLGAGYAFSQKVSVDFAYTHIFVTDGPLELTAAGSNQSRGSLTGNYKNSIDILSAQAKFTF